VFAALSRAAEDRRLAQRDLDLLEATSRSARVEAAAQASAADLSEAREKVTQLQAETKALDLKARSATTAEANARRVAEVGHLRPRAFPGRARLGGESHRFGRRMAR
jgi:hypothetical protein